MGLSIDRYVSYGAHLGTHSTSVAPRRVDTEGLVGKQASDEQSSEEAAVDSRPVAEVQWSLPPSLLHNQL